MTSLNNNLSLYIQAVSASVSSQNLRLQGLENSTDSLPLFLKTAENNVLAEDVVAFYRLEEESGTLIIEDSSWNELDLQDTTQRINDVTGKIGRAGSFAERYPTMAQRTTLAGLEKLRSQSSFTVAGWANPSHLLSSNVIAGIWDTTNTGDQEWALMYQASASGFVLRLNNGRVDFNQWGIGSYGADVDGLSSVFDAGHSIKVEGDSWRQIPFRYNLTANSMISFDFKAEGDEPLLQGVGLDTDTTLSLGNLLTLHGYGVGSGVQSDNHTYNLLSNGGFQNWTSDDLFQIDHETGDLSQYDSTVTDSGDLSVELSAGLNNNLTVIGSELITNGGFSAWTGDNPDGWSVGGESGSDPEVSEVDAGQSHGGTNVTGGFCNIFSTSSPVNITQLITTEIGKNYELTVDVNTIATGSLAVLDEANGDFSEIYRVVGSKKLIFTATTTSTQIRLKRSTSSSDITLDNVSCKEVIGASYGLQCDIDGTGAIYGQKLLSPPTSGFLRIQFYLDPSQLEIGDMDNFVCMSVRSSTHHIVQLRLGIDSGVYEVFTLTIDDAISSHIGVFQSISTGEHLIELLVTKPTTNVSADGSTLLYIDGVLVDSETGIDNFDNFEDIVSIRLGAINSIDAGTIGHLYLDELTVRDNDGEIGNQNPDGWTVVESPSNQEVSQVGTGESHGGSGILMCNLFTDSSSNVEVSQTINTIDGVDYQIDLDIDTLTSGTLRLINDDGDPLFTEDYIEAGEKQAFFTADSTSTLITLKRQEANTDVTINTISCREVVGDSGVNPHTRHYDIPIGSHYTGQMNHLFFSNDGGSPHPLSSASSSSSTYSNLTVYESGQPTEMVVATTGAISNAAGYYHVAGVYDSILNEGKIYLNGERHQTLSFNGVVQNGSGDFSIGGFSNGAANAFNGHLDAIGVWSRPFSERDVTVLYSQGNGVELTPVPNFAPLFLKSPEPSNDNLNLFIEGAISDNSNLTLFLQTIEEANSNIDLVVTGHMVSDETLDLFLKVAEPFNVGATLFLQNYIDTENQTLPLFLNNLSETETLNLYISGSNSSSTEPKPPSEATEGDGFIPINDACTLFLQGNPELEDNLKLFLKTVEGLTNANINLFVDGGNETTSSLNLTIINNLDTKDDNLDLYTHGASN